MIKVPSSRKKQRRRVGGSVGVDALEEQRGEKKKREDRVRGKAPIVDGRGFRVEAMGGLGVIVVRESGGACP